VPHYRNAYMPLGVNAYYWNTTGICLDLQPTHVPIRAGGAGAAAADGAPSGRAEHAVPGAAGVIRRAQVAPVIVAVPSERGSADRSGVAGSVVALAVVTQLRIHRGAPSPPLLVLLVLRVVLFASVTDGAIRCDRDPLPSASAPIAAVSLHSHVHQYLILISANSRVPRCGSFCSHTPVHLPTQLWPESRRCSLHLHTDTPCASLYPPHIS
jgi:hypothetical protein